LLAKDDEVVGAGFLVPVIPVSDRRPELFRDVVEARAPWQNIALQFSSQVAKIVNTFHINQLERLSPHNFN
jgi:hypothetical protein